LNNGTLRDTSYILPSLGRDLGDGEAKSCGKVYIAIIMFRRLIDRSVSSKNVTARAKFSSEKCVVPDLPYDYDALQPFISAEIMQLHHDKHHATYVSGLNTAYDQLGDALAKKELSKVIELEKNIRFNGGGHLNHSIFWGNMRPQKEGGGFLSEGDFSKAISSQFGGQEPLQKVMSSAAMGVQGSGWGWLGYDQVSKSMRITTTINQDPLQATTGLVPLLGLDRSTPTICR
jgi:Fe-Mn family superoxide dismutase